MKIALVAVPYIVLDQHLHLAEQTLNTVRTKHELVKIAVANRLRGENDLAWIKANFDQVLVNERNNLARAWNRGIQLALEIGAQYVLVSNLDLIYQIGSIDRLVEFAQKTPQTFIWSACDHKDLATLEQRFPESKFDEGVAFASFLVDHKLFAQVGQFDEGFEGAYFEDSDMDYRLRLSKLSRITTKSAFYYHLDRGTVKALALGDQSELVNEIDQMRERNHQRYIAKWGGDIWQERFSLPFDGK